MIRAFATVIVGDSLLLREGISRILAPAGFRIIASASRVDELVLGSLPRHRSLLLIIDACNDHDAAVGQIELFKEQHPAGRIVVLTDHYELSDVLSSYRAGAHGYFAKVATCEAFIKSLELIMLGETILPMAILSFILDREDEAIASDVEHHAHELVQPESNDRPRLSPQEKTILRCLIEGDSNKAIARKLHIAEATVKAHVKAILRKARAHNRTQAAIWAMNNDLALRDTNNGAGRVQAHRSSPVPGS